MQNEVRVQVDILFNQWSFQLLHPVRPTPREIGIWGGREWGTKTNIWMRKIGIYLLPSVTFFPR